MKKITPMQHKFEAKMLRGESITVAQLTKMGYANPSDAAYKARQKGIDVQRFIITNKTGVVSCYSL